jgi:1,4-alpha-glucan branching enzyme
VIFDAAQGTQGLMNYSGDIYAHTGVNVMDDGSLTTWKYTPAWANASSNIPKYKLTPLGGNKHQLAIAPNMRDYYGVAANEEIVKLCFVFRDATGSKEGKDIGGSDIFVDVVDMSLHVSFEQPSQKNLLIEKNTIVPIKINAILQNNINLYINNDLIASSATSPVIHSYTFTSAGNYELIAEACDDLYNCVYDTVWLCARQDVEQTARPANLEDGITVYEGTDSVSFSLYAPYKDFIYLIGDFNDWIPNNDYLMKKDGDYFWLIVHGLQPNTEYAFQYFVDGSIRSGDPYCKKILDPWNDKWIPNAVYPNLKAYPTNKTNYTVSVFNTTPTTLYAWTDDAYQRPPKEQLIIYELHLRDFTVQGSNGIGTLNTALPKLDYIQNLGVNAIELMPMQEFDGNDSWGYNPTFYFAPDKAYGTADDLKNFINECHNRGIAVILDVVFNHAWGECPLIKLWWDAANSRPAANSPYANAVAKHDFNVGSDFNHESPATRAYFKKVLKYWLEEYHFDGYRFDLSKGFTQKNTLGNTNAWGNYDASRIAILTDYNNTIIATDPTAYHILEHFADVNEEKELANAGMLLWNNMNNASCQLAMGYNQNSDFNGFVAANRGITVPNLVGFMESHDEERVGYKTKQWGNFNMSSYPSLRAEWAANAAAFALLTPGPHMIWQFGELDYDFPIEYNGRTGRKPVRWDYFEDTIRKYVYNCYSNFLELRKHFPQVFVNQTSPQFTASLNTNITNSLRKIVYNTNDLKMVLLGNFSDSLLTASVTLPELESGGKYYDYLRQIETNYSGTVSITIPKHKILLLVNTLTPLVAPWFDINFDSIENYDSVMLYPNPAIDELIVECGNLQINNVSIFDVSGKVVNNFRFSVFNSKLNIDVSKLQSGTYFLRIGKKTIKFIKIKK